MPTLTQTFEIREQDSFAFARRIDRPGHDLDAILDWCKHECQCDWRWQMLSNSGQNENGEYIFYFDAERDCMAFTLKWA